MSITKINLSIKQSVLLRLIKNGESLEDASSKAGLCINLAKNYLKPKIHLQYINFMDYNDNRKKIINIFRYNHNNKTFRTKMN